MMVVSLKEGAGSGSEAPVFRIGFSDGSLFSFKSSYFSPVYGDASSYIPGREVSADEEGAFRFAASCYRTERIALRLIARAEQTCPGLSRKLKQRGHDPVCIRAVISGFVERGIVSDRRYAELWIQSRLARKVESPRRLIAALCDRGIARDTAAAAYKAILEFEDELVLLKRYLDKNHPGFAGNPSAGTYTALKYKLKYEGFSPEVLEQYRDIEGF
jgi:regulatory protein